MTLGKFQALVSNNFRSEIEIPEYCKFWHVLIDLLSKLLEFFGTDLRLQVKEKNRKTSIPPIRVKIRNPKVHR